MQPAGPRTRKAILAVHILASVGWMGAVIAYLVFDATAAASPDPEALRTAYAAMERLALVAITPLAVLAFATGLATALWSPWGLFRHYWVIASLILTGVALAVLVVELRTISRLAAAAADPATTDAALRSLPDTLPHSVGGLLVLAVVLAINVYKPRGATRFASRHAR